jgi:hypothetical protein
MPNRSALLADFAAHYIWWRGDEPPSQDRIIAQVMNLGTYEDIRRLEAAFAPGELRGVMLRAAAGWISDRSWNFWRGRLRHAGIGSIPEAAPRRPFLAEVL